MTLKDNLLFLAYIFLLLNIRALDAMFYKVRTFDVFLQIKLAVL